MKNKEIIILGAGIGGLSAGIALSLKGFRNIKVYERQQSDKNNGLGLVLWPNAVCILNKFGLEDKIKEIGGKLVKMRRVAHNGDELGEIPVSEIEKLIGFPSHPVTRNKLQKILAIKLKSLGIQISYSKNAENIYKDELGKTQVVFSDGETISPEVVIGADGRMKSIAKKYVLGNNEPIYQHYVNWVGLIEDEKIALNSEQSVYDYWGVGERFGYVPINETSSYWAGCKKLPEGLAEAECGSKLELLEIFKNWPRPIAEIIHKTPERNIKRIEVYDHNPIDKWYLDNVCLLGDAAHASLPTSGQGACQAIEDSWHLANCLWNSCSNIELAFSNYQKLRYRKTKAIAIGAREFAHSLFNEDAEFCKLRNKKAKMSDGKSQAIGMASLWAGGLPGISATGN